MMKMIVDARLNINTHPKKEENTMCSKNQYKCFMIAGCVTYTATLIGLVCSIIGIVKGIIGGIGFWPITGAIICTIALAIIGFGLGFLFQAVAYFVKRFDGYKCTNCNHKKE